MSVNDIQRQMMRHALGLDYGPTAYRNRYTCGSTAAEDLWLDIFDKGLAVPSNTRTWHVTRAGFAAVALPGEIFDDETFAGVDKLEAERAAKGSDWVGTSGHHRRVKALKERSKPAPGRIMSPLPELAALAVERVPGFVRPTRECRNCGGTGSAIEPRWHVRQSCQSCLATGDAPDNSPAALLMAVELCAVKCGARYQIDDGIVMVTTDKRTGAVASPMEVTPEAIARAALVALLRAHGVEVPSEPA